MSAAVGAHTDVATLAKKTFAVWGGTAELLVTDPEMIGAGGRLLADDLARIDAACSRFRADSELSRVNAAHGAVTPVSALFLDFLGVALTAAAITDGAVDPTCGSALLALGYDRDFAELRRAQAEQAQSSSRSDDPAGAGSSHGASAPPGPVSRSEPRGPGRHRRRGRGTPGVPVPGWRTVESDPAGRTVRVPDGVRLDFGATAKAYAADRTARRLAAELGCGVLVNLSGDISIAGAAPDGGWPVLAADGERTDADAPGQTIALHDGGAATSGTTVRTWLHDGRPVHHIIDPATGRPAAPHWLTVSAVAGTCLDANILTTAALVRGPGALPFLAASGCPMRLLGADGVRTLLGGWPEEDGRR